MDQVAAWFGRDSAHLMAALETVILSVAASVLVFLVRRLSRTILKRGELQAGLSIETIVTVTRVMTGIIWAIAALLILDIWGVKVGALWAVVASAAATFIGIGFFANWMMVGNITASFYIGVWRPFRLGDIIEVLPEAAKGRVIDRNLLFVTLREESGNLIQVPNALLFQKMFKVSGGEDRSFFEALEAKAAPKQS